MINIKTKVLRLLLSILFKFFDIHTSKTSSVFGYSEGVCWRLFWGCLLKVILRVYVEGHSEGLLKVILRVSVEGYSEGVCWRLIWGCLHVEGYSKGVCWRLFWGCLLKVIPKVSVEGYSKGVCWRLFWGCLLKVILKVSVEG